MAKSLDQKPGELLKVEKIRDRQAVNAALLILHDLETRTLAKLKEKFPNHDYVVFTDSRNLTTRICRRDGGRTFIFFNSYTYTEIGKYEIMLDKHDFHFSPSVYDSNILAICSDVLGEIRAQHHDYNGLLMDRKE